MKSRGVEIRQLFFFTSSLVRKVGVWKLREDKNYVSKYSGQGHLKHDSLLLLLKASVPTVFLPKLIWQSLLNLGSAGVASAF